MISRRLFSIFLILIPALLWHLSSPSDCHSYAFAYIPNSSDNNVSFVKVRDNVVDGSIAVGTGPYGVAADNKYLYVSNTLDGTISVIDMSYNNAAGTLNAGDSPRGIAALSDGSYIYVANHSDNTLSIIDVSDNSQTTLNVGAGPIGVALNRDEEYIYVTNNSDDSLSIISVDSNEIFATLSNHHYIKYNNDPDEDIAFDEPYGVAVSADGYRIFIVNNGNNTLSILSTSEIYAQGDDLDWDDYDPDDDEDGPYVLYAPVEVGNEPRCVAVTPDQEYLYVTNYGDDTVSVIDIVTSEVSETISVGDGPYGISAIPSGAFIYVVNQLDGTVSVIDTDYDSDSYNTVIDTVEVGNLPTGFGNFIEGKAPNPPSNLKTNLKDTYTIELTWDDNSDDELGFEIFRKRYINGTYSLLATLDENTTSYTDEDLEASSNYYYLVAAYNHMGYSEYTEEEYTATGDDSGCFIATAAYGSQMEPHVKTLREFRDRFMNSNSLGRSFLRLYYRYSPAVAHYIEDHDFLRSVIRWSLLPVVGISSLFLSMGPLSALAILGISIFLVLGVVIVFKSWALSRIGKCIAEFNRLFLLSHKFK